MPYFVEEFDTQEELYDAIDEACREVGGRITYCRPCAERLILNEEAATRYSFGVYATKACDDCWKSHPLNHDDDGKTFDPLDAGESMEEP